MNGNKGGCVYSERACSSEQRGGGQWEERGEGVSWEGTRLGVYKGGKIHK